MSKHGWFKCKKRSVWYAFYRGGIGVPSLFGKCCSHIESSRAYSCILSGNAFYKNGSHLRKKFYKLGYRALKTKWEEDWQERVIRFAREQARKDTVFLCLTGGMITDVVLDAWHGAPLVLFKYERRSV